MKVSTDSILLGSWAYAEEGFALDIGTGCGILALMLAQRYPQLMVIGIDIDDHSFRQGQYNVDCSPWSDRIEIIQGDIRHYNPEMRFNTVICNPPYFRQSLVPTKLSRANARHDMLLSFNDLWGSINVLVNPNGRVNIIVPYSEFKRLAAAAHRNDWRITRQLNVSKNRESPPKLILTEWRKQYQVTSVEEGELFIHEANGAYTAAFQMLTGAFYR